jgi:hypothetical protein
LSASVEFRKLGAVRLAVFTGVLLLPLHAFADCTTETPGSFAAASCALAAAATEAPCVGLRAKVAAGVTARLDHARTIVGTAEAATGRRRVRLLKKARARVRAAGAKLRRAKHVDPTCRSAALARFDALAAMVAALRDPATGGGGGGEGGGEGGQSGGIGSYAGLPADVDGFQAWLRMNARPIRGGPGDAHGGDKLVYVNQTRERIAPSGALVFPFPAGTLIAKSSPRPGDDFVGNVAIMRKQAAGFDPFHGDWEYVEYARPTPTAPFTELARGSVCWSCHSDAEDRDWVFTPLDPAQ